MAKKKGFSAKKKTTKPAGSANPKGTRSAHLDRDADSDAGFEENSREESDDDPVEKRVWFLLNQLSKFTKDAPEEGDRSAPDAKIKTKSSTKGDGKAKSSSTRRREEPTSPSEFPKIYQLKISVRGLKPPSWFRLLITDDSTFQELDREIRSALGWSNDHLHDFSFKNPSGRVRSIALAKRSMESDYEESTTRLCEIFELPVKKIRYTYNFSRSLELNITLEKVIEDEFLAFPKIIKKVGRFPDEDGEFEDFYDDFDENHHDHRDYDHEEEED